MDRNEFECRLREKISEMNFNQNRRLDILIHEFKFWNVLFRSLFKPFWNYQVILKLNWSIILSKICLFKYWKSSTKSYQHFITIQVLRLGLSQIAWEVLRKCWRSFKDYLQFISKFLISSVKNNLIKNHFGTFQTIINHWNESLNQSVSRWCDKARTL